MKATIQRTRGRPQRVFAALLTLAFLGGCATFSTDGGLESIQTAGKERGLTQNVAWLKTDKDAETARASVKKLLAAPLTADNAVQIALLNNRGLQATYA